MRFVLIALALVSCVSVKKPFTVDQKEIEIASLKQTDVRLSYLLEDNMCHIQYGICLGEKKKTPKECSQMRETCVVNVYNQWKDLIK